MGLTAFFAQDRLSDSATQVSFAEALMSSSEAPYTNALDDRPRLVWQAPTPGYWSIPSTFIDINEGAGEISVSIPTLSLSAHNLALAIQNVLNLSALTLTYSVTYSDAAAKFSITVSSGTFNVLWSSGTNGGASGDNPRQWLGWGKTAADTGLAATHVAPERRYGT